MAKIESWLHCDLKKAVQVQELKGNVFSLDNNGSRIRVRIFDNGEKATVSGTVTAKCILADDSTVNVNGSLATVDGQSVASVDIPQGCLLVPGTIRIAIKLTDSSVITTLAAVISTVYRTSTDNVITPSAQIIADWNQEISDALAAQDAQIEVQDGKIDDLKSAIRIIKPENMFDRTDYKNNQRIDNLGRLMNATGYFVTHYMPIVPGYTYTKNSPVIDAYHRMAYYNAAKEPITTAVFSENTTTAPEGAAYAAFCGKLEELSSAEFYLESAVDIIARKDIDNLHKVTTIIEYDGLFYIGGFNASQGYWIASTTNIVTPYDSPVWLNEGDSVYLTSYPTGTMLRAFYRESAEDTFTAGSWITSNKYTIPATGNYWFEISTQSDITDINDVRSLFRIDKYTSPIDYVCREGTINQRTDFHVKSINHRGANRYAPENTLPAFELSAKLGWQYVETDVKSTSDGVLVLLHDATINRTARNADGTTISGDVNIADITYEEALTYDFGIYKGAEYAGTKIPTLTDFLKLCRRKSLCAYLDFGSIGNSTIIQNTINAVRRNGMAEFVTYVGRMTPITIVVSIDPKARVIVIESPTVENVAYVTENLLTGSNEVVFSVQTGTYSDADIERLATAKIPAEVYTPNSMSDVVALDPYFTGITSDYLIAGKVLYNNGINYEAT